MAKLVKNEGITKTLLNGTPYETESKIADLKQKLSATDYQAIKYAEGLLTAEEYAPVKAQRQTWRNEINALEAEN